VSLGVADEHLGGVKAQRLVEQEGAVNGGGIVRLEIQRLVGQQRQGRRVRFAKAVTRKGRQLPKDLGRRRLVHAVDLGVGDEAQSQLSVLPRDDCN